jgi:hypothetical protein
VRCRAIALGINIGLRDNLTATIRRDRAGETFEVAHDGEPVGSRARQTVRTRS